MSNIPRLSMEQLRPEIARALRARVERLGYLGEFFRVAGNQPAALGAFNALTEALKEALPEDLTEVVALTVATRLQNAYERHQHERLSVKLGFGEAWIAKVERLEPDVAAEMDDRQRAAQRLAIGAVDRGGRGCLALVDALVDQTDAQTAVAILMLIGRYVSHALIVNALELAPPVASIFPPAAVR